MAQPTEAQLESLRIAAGNEGNEFIVSHGPRHQRTTEVLLHNGWMTLYDRFCGRDVLQITDAGREALKGSSPQQKGRQTMKTRHADREWSPHKFGQAFRLWRGERAWGGARRLAKALDVYDSRVNGWLRLGQAPRVHLWSKIAKVFGVTVADLTRLKR